MSALIVQGQAWKGAGVVNMGRAVNSLGISMNQSMISTVTYALYKRATGVVVVAAGTSLTLATVVFNSLQVTDIWTKDATGYNFRHDAAALADGNTWYRYVYTFTPTSGQPFIGVFDVLNKDPVPA